jgi:hypothetical protein
LAALRNESISLFTETVYKNTLEALNLDTKEVKDKDMFLDEIGIKICRKFAL